MKTLRRLIFSIIGFILVSLSGLFLILFFKPTMIVNPKNLHWVIQRSGVFKKFSWKSAQIDHEWMKWNERRLSGEFKEFCFNYKGASGEFEGCIDFQWDFIFRYEKGFNQKTIKPFSVSSDHLALAPSSQPETETSSRPVPIDRYWRMFWSRAVPDVVVDLKKIDLRLDGNIHRFDLFLNKTDERLLCRALGFKLDANPKGFLLTAPAQIAIPQKVPGLRSLSAQNFILAGEVQSKGLELDLKGDIEVLRIKGHSFIEFPIRESFSSLAFFRQTLEHTTLDVEISSVKTMMRKMGEGDFTSLPAPFNAMDGMITMHSSIKGQGEQEALISSLIKIDLEGGGEIFKTDLQLQNHVDLKLRSLLDTSVEIIFHRVALELPRLSKKERPPQFMPDARFTTKNREAKKKKGAAKNLALDLLTEEGKPLSITTNLLDEPLRLSFDLRLKNGGIQDGFLRILPLTTKVFKRKIELKTMQIDFSDRADPTLNGSIVFVLPEYRVTLDLKGPTSHPRYAFRSEPPLPLGDIYAVLLFGRPMSDLSSDDKTAAQKTNRMLSQGLLSLAVLYYFAGSPVEYIGYDPSSSNVTAQFGLSKKNSLYISGGGTGVNATGVRRSLGKGWYLDTSIQSQGTTSTTTTSSDGRIYGVLLERIIAY